MVFEVAGRVCLRDGVSWTIGRDVYGSIGPDVCLERGNLMDRGQWLAWRPGCSRGKRTAVARSHLVPEPRHLLLLLVRLYPLVSLHRGRLLLQSPWHAIGISFVHVWVQTPVHRIGELRAFKGLRRGIENGTRHYRPRGRYCRRHGCAWAVVEVLES